MATRPAQALTAMMRHRERMIELYGASTAEQDRQYAALAAELSARHRGEHLAQTWHDAPPPATSEVEFCGTCDLDFSAGSLDRCIRCEELVCADCVVVDSAYDQAYCRDCAGAFPREEEERA